MLRAVLPISSLLSGVAILLTGTGLFGTLLAVRGTAEGFPDLTLGLIMSAYFVGFLIGTYACPLAIGRVGHIRAFALFATVASCMPILHGIFVSPWAWAGLRMITGTCLVGLYMVLESWLNTQTPNEHRGQVFAAYMIVNFLALALGQSLLLLYAPTGFELFGLVAVLISLALVPISLTRLAQPQPVAAPKLGLRRLFRDSPAGVAGAFGSGLAMGAFWGMAPVLAQHLGLDNSGVAAFMTAAILGGAALQWPIGRLSDRHDRRFVLAGVAAAGALAALASGLAAQITMPLLLASIFVFGGFGFTLYPVSVAHANDRLGPEHVLQGAGTLLLMHGIGAAIGPALAGSWMHWVGPLGLLVHFAVVLVALGIYVNRQLPDEDVSEPHPSEFMPMVRTTATALEMLTPEPEPAAENSPDTLATTAPKDGSTPAGPSIQAH
jgi:MFS family permease